MRRRCLTEPTQLPPVAGRLGHRGVGAAAVPQRRRRVPAQPQQLRGLRRQGQQRSLDALHRRRRAERSGRRRGLHHGRPVQLGPGGVHRQRPAAGPDTHPDAHAQPRSAAGRRLAGWRHRAAGGDPDGHARPLHAGPRPVRGRRHLPDGHGVRRGRGQQRRPQLRWSGRRRLAQDRAAGWSAIHPRGQRGQPGAGRLAGAVQHQWHDSHPDAGRPTDLHAGRQRRLLRARHLGLWPERQPVRQRLQPGADQRQPQRYPGADAYRHAAAARPQQAAAQRRGAKARTARSRRRSRRSRSKSA